MRYCNMSINLCRICLENTAQFPIFDSGENDTNIKDKLFMCLKEKIEDQEGYPRYICEACKNILDKLCDFIKKYEESTSKLLANNLDVINKENDHLSCNNQSEEDIPIVYIKKELGLINSDEDFCQNEHLKASQKSIKIKKEVTKVTKKKRLSSKRFLDVSNKIATSILEGAFSWNGSEWSLSSKENKVTKPIQIAPNFKRKITKIPKPKPKTPNPPKLCDLCGEIFKTHDSLTSHIKRSHNSEHFECTKCLRSFGSRYHLKRHFKRKHEIERSFVCAVCGKGFSFRGELGRHHKIVHEKHLKPKKQYKCQLCNKIYKCSKSVVIHERSAHTGDRPAVCTVCGTSFFHEDYLREHMRLHTGETPFKCPICGRGYAQRGNMKSHLRIHKRSDLDQETLSNIRPNYLKLLKA